MAILFGLGALGLAWPPTNAGALARRRTTLVALGVGTLALGAGAGLTDAAGRSEQRALAIGLNALAPVAEEAFLRRYLCGILAPFGAAVTVWRLGARLRPCPRHRVGAVGPGPPPGRPAWSSPGNGPPPAGSVPAATHAAANTLALL